MMNKFVGIGRIATDLELRKTANGTSVTNFNIAINASKDKTDFLKVTCWKQLAENVVKYQQKGSLIAVEGPIKTTEYEKNGTKIVGYEVNAFNVVFLEYKDNNNSTQNQNRSIEDDASPSDFKDIDIASDDLPF